MSSSSSARLPGGKAGAALRDMLGASMASAQRTLAAHVKPFALNQRFESELLVSLLNYQPRKRVRPADVEAFMRARRPPHNNVCLFAITSDGQVADVSLIKAVRKLYGRHSPDAERVRRGIQAFRNEAFFSEKMQAARAALPEQKCVQCGKRRKLAVDHDGLPFAQILDEFVADRGCNFKRIGLTWSNGANALRSRALARAWCEWHDARAKLVCLCQKCNSAKGSGGYRYKHLGAAAAGASSSSSEEEEQEGGKSD